MSITSAPPCFSPRSCTTKALPATVRPLCVLGIALSALFLRRPDAFYRPQFWAEDFVFLTSAESRGLATYVEPQAGYLHLIPRTAAWIATRLDPALQPPFFMTIWLIVFVGVVFGCLSPRLDLPLKPYLAAALLLIPHTGEVFFNLTNAQWVAALGLLLTVFKRDPANAAEWAADVLWVVMSGFSGPFAIFMLPLLVQRWWYRRTIASAILLTLAAIAALIQLWFILHADPDGEFSGPFHLFDLFAIIGYRLFGNVYLGGAVADRCGGPILVGLTAAVLALLVGSANAGHRRRELAGLGFLLIFLVTATTIRKRFDLWGFNDMGDRYFFIPKAVLLWITIAAFAGEPRPWRKWVLGSLLASSFALNLPRIHFQAYQDYQWYALCPRIRAGEPVEVTTNPRWKFIYRRGAPESTRRVQ